MVEAKMIAETNKPYRRWPRAYGFVLLVVSFALAKWQIYDPLHAAKSGKQEIVIISSCFIVAVVGGVAGVLYLLFGSKINQWGDRFSPDNVGWKAAVFYICLAMVCLALFIYVLVSLSNQGFRLNQL